MLHTLLGAAVQPTSPSADTKGWTFTIFPFLSTGWGNLALLLVFLTGLSGLRFGRLVLFSPSWDCLAPHFALRSYWKLLFSAVHHAAHLQVLVQLLIPIQCNSPCSASAGPGAAPNPNSVQFTMLCTCRSWCSSPISSLPCWTPCWHT